MVTAPLVTQRPAIASPFGLLADLGAAVGAELGLPVSQIAVALSAGAGRFVGDQQARGAIERGRRELAARRMNRAVFRPAAVPAATASPVRELPDPRQMPDADQIELLLLWAEGGPQRAATLAAKARVVLEEIAGIQQQGTRRQQQRKERRKQAVPLQGATPAQRRAYFAKVRTWAAQNGRRVPDGKTVPTHTVLAYERALAAEQAALQRVTAALAQPRPD